MQPSTRVLPALNSQALWTRLRRSRILKTKGLNILWTLWRHFRRSISRIIQLVTQVRFLIYVRVKIENRLEYKSLHEAKAKSLSRWRLLGSISLKWCKLRMNRWRCWIMTWIRSCIWSKYITSIFRLTRVSRNPLILGKRSFWFKIIIRCIGLWIMLRISNER